MYKWQLRDAGCLCLLLFAGEAAPSAWRWLSQHYWGRWRGWRGRRKAEKRRREDRRRQAEGRRPWRERPGGAHQQVRSEVRSCAAATAPPWGTLLYLLVTNLRLLCVCICICFCQLCCWRFGSRCSSDRAHHVSGYDLSLQRFPERCHARRSPAVLLDRMPPCDGAPIGVLVVTECGRDVATSHATIFREGRR